MSSKGRGRNIVDLVGRKGGDGEREGEAQRRSQYAVITKLST